MNSNWYLYRNFVKPILRKALAVLAVTAVVSTIYWVIYHSLNTTENRQMTIVGCVIGGILGYMIGFLVVWFLESIWAFRKIYKARKFVKQFPTVADACEAYGEDHSIEELCVVFTEETVKRASRKTGFYAG